MMLNLKVFAIFAVFLAGQMSFSAEALTVGMKVITVKNEILKIQKVFSDGRVLTSSGVILENDELSPEVKWFFCSSATLSPGTVVITPKNKVAKVRAVFKNGQVQLQGFSKIHNGLALITNNVTSMASGAARGSIVLSPLLKKEKIMEMFEDGRIVTNAGVYDVYKTGVEIKNPEERCNVKVGSTFLTRDNEVLQVDQVFSYYDEEAIKVLATNGKLYKISDLAFQTQP